MQKKFLYILLFITVVAACKPNSNTGNPVAWQQQLAETLPMLGHRNWIIVADKAFPMQTDPGIAYIYADKELLTVLQEVVKQVEQSGHVKPEIYRDKELAFIEDNNVRSFIAREDSLLKGKNIQTLLHDSCFKKLSEESKQFKVLVIKTNELLPYTSVFIRLDCAYWDAGKEQILREKMK